MALHELDTTRLAALTAALEDDKAALEEKGVIVPEGTLHDGIAELIRTIASGDVVGVAHGEFTVTVGGNYCPGAIEHGLGRKPMFAQCRIKNIENYTVDQLKGCVLWLTTYPTRDGYYSGTPSYNVNTGNGNNYTTSGIPNNSAEISSYGVTYFDEEIVIFKSPLTGNDKFKACTYEWWVA